MAGDADATAGEAAAARKRRDQRDELRSWRWQLLASGPSGSAPGSAEPSGGHVPIPDGFVAQQQRPMQALSEADLKRWIMAVIKLPRSPLGWHQGQIVKYYSQEGQGRYVGKYNCDVLFAGSRGAVGMMLVPTSEVMEYDASASADAAEGTWFFINKIAE